MTREHKRKAKEAKLRFEKQKVSIQLHKLTCHNELVKALRSVLDAVEGPNRERRVMDTRFDDAREVLAKAEKQPDF